MNNKKTVKFTSLFLICIAAFCLFTFVGRTLAAFTGTDSVKNSIKAGELKIEVIEEKDHLQKTSVTIKNTKDVKCYIRLRVSVPNIEGLKGELSFDLTPLEDGGDKFYYYPKVMLPGESIQIGKKDENPFYSASFLEGLDDKEKERIAKLGDVVIYVEAVQADNILESNKNQPNSLAAAMEAFENTKK